MSFAGQEIIRDRHNKPIYSRTEGQSRLIDTIMKNNITFVSGPSGTGKTAIATWLGINGIDDGIYEHLVLTRPVVTSGEELGFLPGGLDEKIAPYMQPLYDSISLIKGKRTNAEEELVQQVQSVSPKDKKRAKSAAKNSKGQISTPNSSFYDKVQVCPLAFIRGSTLAKSFIVCDEFQNTTVMQMKMMITRLGKGSKMVICGDENQCDLPDRVESGFSHAMRLLRGVPGIGFATLGVDDIVRHRMIKEIILRYEVPGYKFNSGTMPDPKIVEAGWHRDEEGYDFDPIDETDEYDSSDFDPIDETDEYDSSDEYGESDIEEYAE